jgi:hypothetical protein
MKKETLKSEEGIVRQKMYGGKLEVVFMGPTEEKQNRHIYQVNGERKTGVTTYLGIKDKSIGLVSWATETAADYLVDKLEKGEKITVADIYTAQDLHAQKKQEAADIGTVIHDWCEKYIKHKLKIKGFESPEIPEDESAIIGVNAFLDWEKEHKVKFVSSERVIYSRKYDYIGKMDIEAYVDGDLCLVDLKSSNGLYNTVRAQTAAYLKADEEESDREYVGRWAIRLSKETEKEYIAKCNKKNKKRIIMGKGPQEIKPYQIFEAKYFDADKGEIESDFEAFLHMMKLHRWDAKTDFWKVANSK